MGSASALVAAAWLALGRGAGHPPAPGWARAPAAAATTPPSSVTPAAPCAGVPVAAGADLQAIVDANPPRTTLCLAGGVYHPSSLAPKAGDVIDGGGGAIFDGRSKLAHAIVGGSAPDVTVRGLTIEHYASPLQSGALQSFGTTGWVIEDNHITHNAGAGLTFDGGARVIGNVIDHNTQEGYACHGDHDLLQGNTIAYNNAALTVNWQWEAGGGKCWGTRYLTVEGNDSHDNGGPGLWTDTDNVFTVYDHNTVTDNYGPGIMHEISWSATITANTVRGNGFGDRGGWLWDAGILLSSSGGQDATHPIVVAGNTVSANYNGISIVEQPRGSGTYGTHRAQDIHVSGNSVAMTTGVTGVGARGSDQGLWTRDITFAGDTYSVANIAGRWFVWGGAPQAWSEWRSLGNDPDGRVST